MKPLSWPLRVAAIIVAAWLIAPTLVVIPLSLTDRPSFEFPPRGWSLRYYERFFTDPEWLYALFNSAQLALITTVIATIAGTAASFALVRSAFFQRRLVGGITNGVLLAPIIVPGVIVAIAVYSAFLTLGLVGTPAGFVAAHTVLAIPYVIVTVTSALRTFDPKVEQAAASLGAPPRAVLRRITLPLILPGIASGAVFAFVTSFDEVVVSLFIQSPELQTLPVRMFTSVTTEVDPTIAAASTVVVLLTTALILIPQLMRRTTHDG